MLDVTRSFPIFTTTETKNEKNNVKGPHFLKFCVKLRPLTSWKIKVKILAQIFAIYFYKIITFWNVVFTSPRKSIRLNEVVISCKVFCKFNHLSAKPIKCSNTLKQFVDFCRRIVWMCLTILWGWRLKGKSGKKI